MLSPFPGSLSTDTVGQKLGCSETFQSTGFWWPEKPPSSVFDDLESELCHHIVELRKSRHFCLAISSFLSSTLTLGCFIGFNLHRSDFVSYNVQKSSIIVSSRKTRFRIPNPAPQVFYFGSVDVIFYKQGPDGSSCCSKEFFVASFSFSCHAKLLSTDYSERPGFAETRFIWIFFSEASSKRLWDRMEQAAAWSLHVTVGFYVRCLIRFRHIFMLNHKWGAFKNVTLKIIYICCALLQTPMHQPPQHVHVS